MAGVGVSLLAICACGGSETAAPTPSPSLSAPASTAPASSPGEETPVARQVLAPATDAPVANLCTAGITATADGNAAPLLCKSGAVNVQAWRFYATVSASVLGLGLNPTEGQVESAVCDDLNHNHATRAEEASGYTLASTYYGWTFGLEVAKVSCT